MKPLAFVIEDTDDIAQVFRTAMEEAGYQAEVISDGELALKRLEEVVPDLTVLDLHLPGASGEKILKYIRSDSRLEDIKVIVATADSNWADKLASDSTISMLKPISFTQLQQIAERLKPRDN
ncbi:MAG: response regulator [Anaerolineales bacterium]|jgi:DNA-binding response OmpR family regulator